MDDLIYLICNLENWERIRHGKVVDDTVFLLRVTSRVTEVYGGLCVTMYTGYSKCFYINM
jgi:hypothetical protein